MKSGRGRQTLPGVFAGRATPAPEGYVWVLSQNVPFYHARVLGCPRSRCHENGRIFSPRGSGGAGRRRLRARVCVVKWLEEEDVTAEESLPRLARRPGLRRYQPRPQTPIHGHRARVLRESFRASSRTDSRRSTIGLGASRACFERACGSSPCDCALIVVTWL